MEAVLEAILEAILGAILESILGFQVRVLKGTSHLQPMSADDWGWRIFVFHAVMTIRRRRIVVDMILPFPSRGTQVNLEP